MSCLKSLFKQGARLMFVGVALLLLCGDLGACTIFVLSDAKKTLFFNNEDWSNPKSRIWFIPTGAGYLGCGYVGFDDGWAQGGLNTEGLAFDWVAGGHEEWQPDNGLKVVRGNPSERMLETCSTVEQAISFYKTYREPSFASARILIADKSGASVIIGLKNGKLEFDHKAECRGMGYGGSKMKEMVARKPEPTVGAGIQILRASLQEGQYATKYSNVFDLMNGDIRVFNLAAGNEEAKLNLGTELRKESHYYDIPDIGKQLKNPEMPLLANMKRLPLDAFHSIPDPNPVRTAHVKAMIQDVLLGTMKASDYSDSHWAQFSDHQKEAQADLQKFGQFISLDAVNGQTEGKLLYRMEFTKASVAQRFDFDEDGKLKDGGSEGVEFKALPVEHTEGSEIQVQVHNRQVSYSTEKERQVIHLEEREGDGVAWWNDKVLANGTIELDVRGTNSPQKSFVGVAFHGMDEKTYDAIYLRPFNFQSTDPARRSHGVQYVAHPTFTWNKLRDEQPGKFESEVSPAPDPNGWVHLRILVEGRRARVFVNHAEKAALDVEMLSDRKKGWVGFWVGNGSAGDFANLKITPSDGNLSGRHD